MDKKLCWLKRIVIVLLVIFILSECVFFGINFINKYKIAEMLRIKSVTDFFVIGLYDPNGPGSDHALTIKFIISSDAYERNELNYYLGKKKIFLNYYKYMYQDITYDRTKIKEFRELRDDRIRLEKNTIVLILLIFAFKKIQLKEKAIKK